MMKVGGGARRGPKDSMRLVRIQPVVQQLISPSVGRRLPQTLRGTAYWRRRDCNDSTGQKAEVNGDA
jgi:hypothetical protein